MAKYPPRKIVIVSIVCLVALLPPAYSQNSDSEILENGDPELRYSDGRVKRTPFIAFPEILAKAPAVDSFILRREESMKRF